MTTPFRALLVREPHANGFTDSAGVSAVEVLEIDRAKGLALVAERIGSARRKNWVAFASLATTPERAAEILRPYLSALASRPLLSSVAGTTDASAATPAAKP